MRRDGSEFPVELTITRIALPGPPTFTGYLRDITERVTADRDLRASRARLVGVVGLLVIAAMMTVGLGDLGGVVQRLFIALLFGAPVALTGWSRTRWAVTGAPVCTSR